MLRRCGYKANAARLSPLGNGLPTKQMRVYIFGAHGSTGAKATCWPGPVPVMGLSEPLDPLSDGGDPARLPRARVAHLAVSIAASRAAAGEVPPGSE